MYVLTRILSRNGDLQVFMVNQKQQEKVKLGTVYAG